MFLLRMQLEKNDSELSGLPINARKAILSQVIEKKNASKSWEFEITSDELNVTYEINFSWELISTSKHLDRSS